MSRFVIHINEKKKKRQRLFAYVFAGTGLLTLLLIIVFDDTHKFRRFGGLFIAIMGLWSAVSSFRNMDKVRFVDIDEDHIEWDVYEKSENRILIYWKDIRWIKNEKDNSVTIYQDSSFSNNFSLAEFTDQDKNQLLYSLQEYAGKRQISVINFSGMPLAVA